MAILEKVPVKFSLLPVASLKKKRGRQKVTVEISNSKFATGMKKCHGKKKTQLSNKIKKLVNNWLQVTEVPSECLVSA